MRSEVYNIDCMEYIRKADVLAEIARLQDSTMDDDGNFPTKSAMEQYNILCELEFFINKKVTMDSKKVYKEVSNMKKVDILYLIENLMIDGKIDITDIAISHTKVLESKIAKKDEIIHQADNCIFESVFTDSLGKPADNAALMRKVKWLGIVGTHNMDGIMKFIKK